VARRRRPSPRDIEQVWLGEQIQRIHAASDGTYGSPKVHAQLRREGIHVSRGSAGTGVHRDHAAVVTA
jgi:putative transposase